MAYGIFTPYLSRARAAKVRSELPPSITIHGQIPACVCNMDDPNVFVIAARLLLTPSIY